jgi:hypothetical protein
MVGPASPLELPLHPNLGILAQRRRGFFAKLTKRRLKRGVFLSVVDLQAAINRFVVEHNAEPKPFTWTADRDNYQGRQTWTPSVRFDPLGSRYCETDRLSNAAWSLFGQVPKGWPLVTACYQHASPIKTAWDAHTELRGVCRDFAHLAITLLPLYERSGALLHRLSRRHRRAGRRFAYGFQRLVRSLSRQPLVYIRCPSQQSAHRPHLDGTRARRHRCSDRDLIRPVHARELQGNHTRGHIG